MKCDICGPGDKKEIGNKVVSHEPFLECIKLECGDGSFPTWWRKIVD